MNAKFRFYLLKYLSTRRQRGFALPMVMMVGLVIAVVGATMVLQGMGDKNKVVAKSQKQQSQALAEAGITQYMDFLSRHPKLLTANSSNWSTVWTSNYGSGGGGGSSSSSSSSSSVYVPPQSGAQCQTTEYDSARQPINTASSTSSVTPSTIPSSQVNSWILDLAERSVGNGKIKFVGYTYDASRNAGALSVRGILRGDDGTVITSTQIQTIISVRPEAIVTTTGSPQSVPIIPQIGSGGPGLWARSFDTESGSAPAHAHVLDSSGCATGMNSFTSQALNLPALPLGALPNGNQTPDLSGTAGTITKQDIPFPPLPAYPSATDTSSGTLSNDNFPDLVAQNKVNVLSDCSRTQFPATGDYDADGVAYSASTTTPKVYKYRVTGACALQSDTQFGTTGKGNELIIMYLDDDITVSNNGKLSTSGTSNAKVHWHLKDANLELRGNAQVGGASPTGGTAKNWVFFLHNGTEVDLRGTADHYAFIFAPKATADMRGNPKIGGALWVNRFETKGAPPKVFQALNQNDFNQILTDAYNASGQVTYTVTQGASTTTTTPPGIAMVGSYSDAEENDNAPTVPSYVNYAMASASSGASSSSSSTTSNSSSSSSQNQCTMPNLVGTSTTGKTADTLLTAVKDLLTGFTGTPTGTENTGGASDTILTQTPAASSQVDCGTQVTFTYKLPTVLACSISVPSSITPKKGSTTSVTITYTNANSTTIKASSSNNNAVIDGSDSTTVTGNGSASFSFKYDNGNGKTGTLSFSGCGSSASTNFTTIN